MTMRRHEPARRRRTPARGMSLIEIMIAMVISMFTVLAIVQVMSTQARQQRLGSSVARVMNEAVVSIALIERDLQQAGYALANNRLQSCTAVNSLVSGAAIANLSTAAVTIVDGGAGAPDTLRIRFGESVRADAPLTLAADMASPIADIVVGNAYGVRDGDLVLLADGAPQCTLVQASSVDTSGAQPILRTATTAAPNYNPGSVPAGWPTYTVAAGTQVYVVGTLTQRTYTVDTVNRRLQAAEMLDAGPTAIVENVYLLKAQYGISASAGSDTVTEWVNATGGWANPSVADRKRIKAVRVAIVARSDEADSALPGSAAIEIWPAVTAGNGQLSPAVTVTPGGDDRKYRYRVLRTVVPLRNLMWSTLS